MTVQLRLPCGLERPGGAVLRDIEIQKLKGRTQRDIAKLAQGKKRPNPGRIGDAIIGPSIVGIGGQPVGLGVLRALCAADRDWLMFEIRKATWGDTVTMSQPCSDCDDKSYDYRDFPLSTLATTALPETADWWDGRAVTRIVENQGTNAELKFRVFVLQHDSGAEGVFRYPCGEDQERMNPDHNEVEAVWDMLSRTCVRWRDQRGEQVAKPGIQTFTPDFWGDLDADVLDWVQAGWAKAQPGNEMIVELECPEGHRAKARVQPVNFFFPEQMKMSR